MALNIIGYHFFEFRMMDWVKGKQMKLLDPILLIIPKTHDLDP